ncbi:MAG: serine/threonine-protein kinase [Acidobacteriota bacterium]
MTTLDWTAVRWGQVQEILAETLEMEPADRPAWLRERCSDDEGLRQEIETFLGLESEIGDFIEKPCLPGLTAPQQATDLDAGRRLGSYRLVRQIGQGGVGDVYLATREGDYEAQVAVKLIRGHSSAEVAQRFVHERRILAQLEHPFIARLIDGGTTADGRPYFVMEHVEGELIHRYCDSATLSVDERLDLFCKVCEAVAFAHQNLVVHRDLKPSNILVSDGGIPKLLDFGIAKLLADEATAELTVGLAPLTVNYASPEQLLGEAITTASDVYSLGVVLHQLLTGRLPWDLDLTASPSLRAASGEPPRRPSTLVVQVPEERTDLAPEVLSRKRRSHPRKLRQQLRGDLDAVILKALRHEPEARYSSVSELAADIRRHLAGLPVGARRGTLLYRTVKLVRRRKASFLAAAVFLALTIGLAWSAIEAAGQRRRVEVVVGFLEEMARLPDPRQQEEPQAIIAQAKETITSALGGEPEVQARVMETLGRTYGALGALEVAESLIGESLAIRRRLLGDDHRLVAESSFNLAYILRRQDKILQARVLMRSALEILRRKVAGDDLQLARAMTNYAGLLKDLEAYAEAEALYRESLAMKQRLFGEQHREVARGLSNLGTLLEELERYDEAEELFRKALAIRRSELAEDDPELVQSQHHLARLLYRREEYAAAADLFRKVVDRRRQIFGQRHLEVAKSLNNLALCLQRMGSFAEAEPLQQEAVTVHIEVLREDHHDVAVLRRNLASLLLELRRPEEAESLIRQALAGFHISRSEDYWRSADARSVLGACLGALKQFEAAEVLLLESYSALRADKGPESVYTRDAAGRLVDLYRVWGKPGEAARYLSAQDG